MRTKPKDRYALALCFWVMWNRWGIVFEIEPELITVVEGPTPEFRESPYLWFNSVYEGPEDAEVVMCELRTYSGQSIVDRCQDAWQEGRPVRLFGIGIDVTDMLATEDAIRESEARLGDANRKPKAVPQDQQGKAAADTEAIAELPPRLRYPYSVLLARVFPSGLGACEKCGGQMRLVACGDSPTAIKRILTHLGLATEAPKKAPARSPPELEFEFADTSPDDAQEQVSYLN